MLFCDLLLESSLSLARLLLTFDLNPPFLRREYRRNRRGCGGGPRGRRHLVASHRTTRDGVEGGRGAGRSEMGCGEVACGDLCDVFHFRSNPDIERCSGVGFSAHVA